MDVGLTYLEKYISNFIITEENNKFEFYIFPDENSGGVSFIKIRDEIEKDLDISDTTAIDLEDDIPAPIISEKYVEQVTKRMKDDGSMKILDSYIMSIFQDFESSVE